MIGLDHPCAHGLTPECFEKYPIDAKRVFAYRLLHSLFPPHITRRLPRIFRPKWYDWAWIWIPWIYLMFEPYVEPGEEFPPDWTPEEPLPPGVDVDPEPAFPPDWTPEEPLPPGVIVEPPPDFPPDWKPGDPLPPGVIVEPEPAFPPGWSPGQPLPGGVSSDPSRSFPPGWKPEDLPPTPLLRPPIPPAEMAPGGPEPPAYTRIWTPGPAHRVFGGPIEPPFFFDDFDDFTTHNWRKWTYGGATVVVDGGLLTMTAPHPVGVCRAWYFQPTAYPTNWEAEFYMFLHAEDVSMAIIVEFWTGNYRVHLRFCHDGELRYQGSGDEGRLYNAFVLDQFNRFRIIMTGPTYAIYNGETCLKSGALPYGPGLTTKKIWLEHGHDGTTHIDYISIVAL